MMTTTHIQVRDTRDQLLDLLPFGNTYPLRDLTVDDQQLTVAFDVMAKIPILNSQKGVLYQLYHQQKQVERTPEGEQGAGIPIELVGNGETIFLETYKITKDVTFDIFAIKQSSGNKTFLHQTATVKVGLDTSLNASILVPQFAPSPSDAVATYLIHYGEAVDVLIENSQEGVDYRLVVVQDGREETVSVADARGNLRDIVLSTPPMQDDVDIRIRATKTFEDGQKSDTRTALLDVILPLKIRANTELSVTTTAVIDYQQSASLTITDSQQGVQYQLYHYTITDRDFVHGSAPEVDLLRVPVEGEAEVQIVKPNWQNIWVPQAGYQPFDSPQVGTGADLSFTLAPLTDDTLIIVQATKTHDILTASGVIESRLTAVQLKQTAVLLTRPNPAPLLRLMVQINAGTTETNGRLQLSDGQQGVFYVVRSDPQGEALGLPAYFHQHKDLTNKGVGQLVMGVDFVVARLFTITTTDPANTPPPNPIIQTGPLPADTMLHIQAVKAQTGVSTPLTQTALIAALPEIRAEESHVNQGDTARLLVIASHQGDRYEPFLNGESVKRARLGNGEDLSFITNEITENTDFELRVTHPDDTAHLPVDRVVLIRVEVIEPDPSPTEPEPPAE